MTVNVECYACGNEYELNERKRCSCGEPLWVTTDATEFKWPETTISNGLWRYTELLPTDRVAGIVSGAGQTPLVRTPRLNEYAGCRVYIKDEGENPTGSFKDRGSSVGAAYADHVSTRWLGTVSHGNMAMSMSANAASLGLSCLVLVPAHIPEARLGLIAQYDPQILKVEGDYGQLYYDTIEQSKTLPIEFVNSDTPLRIEGQKTVVFEICEQFPNERPDAIVLPVSSGGHASAVWKGLRELRQAGLIGELPRLYFAQTKGVDPIAQAFRDGTSVTPIEPRDTIAFSIANGSPPSGNRALQAARQTGGGVVSVTDDAIRDALRRCAADAGVCAEPSSATPLAAIHQLAEKGELSSDDGVVVITTGTGFKEFAGRNIEVDPSTIGLEDLESILSDVVDSR